MDARVVDNPAYQDEWEKALRSIPSYSLVTDMDHLFDLKTGIYANAQEDGRPWERPTSVELIHGDEARVSRSMQVCVFAEASAVEKRQC